MHETIAHNPVQREYTKFYLSKRTSYAYATDRQCRWHPVTRTMFVCSIREACQYFTLWFWNLWTVKFSPVCWALLHCPDFIQRSLYLSGGSFRGGKICVPHWAQRFMEGNCAVLLNKYRQFIGVINLFYITHTHWYWTCGLNQTPVLWGRTLS